MRIVARGSVRLVELEHRTTWLASLSVLSAAMWGIALGLVSAGVAALVYGDTHEFGLAALSGAGALAASAWLLVVAFGAIARRRAGASA